MRLAVVIVHYRCPDWLDRAIASLARDIQSSAIDAEYWVVDNGGLPDGWHAPGVPPAHVLRPGQNLGYAGGANLAIGRTSADALCIMNPDVDVHVGCLGHLMRALQAGAAAAGPRFYWDEARRVQLPPTEGQRPSDEIYRRLANRRGSWSAAARHRWRHHARRHWRAHISIESWSLSGALLCIRRDAWTRIGPMDPGYRLYFEETDWLERARRAGLGAQ